MGKRRTEPASAPPAERQMPYGWVLIIRGLASAAIELENHPATLRVLCVMADYMDQDGVCRVGQTTIADRMGMSRQAVHKHLKLLDEMVIMTNNSSKSGVTHQYVLNTDGLQEKRAGQDRLDEARDTRKQHSFGHVNLGDREGYPAYLEALLNHVEMPRERRRMAAMDAMGRHEQELGIWYDRVSDADGKWWKKVADPVRLEELQSAYTEEKAAMARKEAERAAEAERVRLEAERAAEAERVHQERAAEAERVRQEWAAEAQRVREEKQAIRHRFCLDPDPPQMPPRRPPTTDFG